MFLKSLLICQILAVLLMEDSMGLVCFECNRERCPPEPSCPGGKVMDVCNCCVECARVKNEECGGPFDIVGVCDQDLVCVKSEPANSFNSNGVCEETFIRKLKQLRK